MKNRYCIIKRPLITEKGMGLVEGENIYPFEVDKKATKIEIARAIQALAEETFGRKVTVLSVRTQARKGKMRMRRMRPVYMNDWKKAYVKLAEGDKLDFL